LAYNADDVSFSSKMGKHGNDEGTGMKTVYVITMWSGGRPAKKWKSYDKPELLPQGTGVLFTSIETKLSVSVIGSISVEEFESGKEEFESQFLNEFQGERDTDFPRRRGGTDESNIERLF